MHLTEEELKSALKKVLETIAAKGIARWQDEVFCRYLLTRGDSLGGSMRNLTGAVAGRQFTSAVLAALKERRIRRTTSTSETNLEKVQAIEWPGRCMRFDRTPRCVGKNIDVIVLKSSFKGDPNDASPADFVACGELKGGIDPAGADEHWKTANSALERIRQSLGKQIPALFFVGAAIETAMAEEIFDQLKDGRLDYAANLTVSHQLSGLAAWLISL